jgi:hypothetical protein
MDTAAGEQVGRARARELVEQITKFHGHVSEEVLARISAEDRQIVKNALSAKDEMISTSITTYGSHLSRLIALSRTRC